MEHWKVLSATIVDRQEKFSKCRRSITAKTTIFWPWWQPFNSFSFETLSFLPLSPFFLFATQNSGGAMAPQSPRCRRPCYQYSLFLLGTKKIWTLIINLYLYHEKFKPCKPGLFYKPHLIRFLFHCLLNNCLPVFALIFYQTVWQLRSILPEVFCKKGVLKN